MLKATFRLGIYLEMSSGWWAATVLFPTQSDGAFDFVVSVLRYVVVKFIWWYYVVDYRVSTNPLPYVDITRLRTSSRLYVKWPSSPGLINRLTPKDFNSYGSRRGNDEVMVRGTFANIRLVNKFVSKSGPTTKHIPSNVEYDVFEAAQIYKKENTPVIILAGKEYGSGSSRDWAAKGTLLLGVKAVIAESYERIHRSNLVGMGVIPLQFLAGQSRESLGLTGEELYDVDIPQNCAPLQKVTVQVDAGRKFEVILRFDTEVDILYYKHGGILNYMIRKMLI